MSTDALKTLDAILQGSAGGTQAQFAPNSRYYALPTTTIMQPDGRVVSYVTRRFVPQPERFATMKQHVVAQGDRIDSIAATYLNDPAQWWRVADANRAVDPRELTQTTGTALRITLPEGVPLGTGKI